MTIVSSILQDKKCGAKNKIATHLTLCYSCLKKPATFCRYQIHRGFGLYRTYTCTVILQTVSHNTTPIVVSHAIAITFSFFATLSGLLQAYLKDWVYKFTIIR